MIWLASFPRSGNTFLRNILFEVYGLASSTFHKEQAYPLDANYDQFPVVKTHLLPDLLSPADPEIPAVYLVRDGRDALVSIAHHRKDIYAPDSSFEDNLAEAIIAQAGSYFGGWSENVTQWLARADLLIRYEDLIVDPLAQVERLRTLLALPTPKRERLPTFQAMQNGQPKYGAGVDIAENSRLTHNLAKKNFRRGVAGGWVDEMTAYHQELFWSLHGECMGMLGYSKTGEIEPPNQDLDYPLAQKLGLAPKNHHKPKRLLVESSKIVMPGNDGVKRYQVQLLQALSPICNHPAPRWQIDLLLNGHIYPLHQLKELLTNSQSDEEQTSDDALLGYEKQLLRVKKYLQNILAEWLYRALSKGYHALPFRPMLRLIRGLCQWPGHIGRFLFSRKQRGQALYDLVHVPLPQHWFFVRNFRSQFITTVHDLTHRHFPDFHEKGNIRNTKRGIKWITATGSAVIAVSEATKIDAIQHENIAAEKIQTIHEAADRSIFRINSDALAAAQVRKKYGIPSEPYLLCLSTIEPRKNLRNTILAFIALTKEHPNHEVNLVICGKKGWKTNALFQDESLRSTRVFFTGFVDEEDLHILYSEAVALAYISFYEGFGLPLLEAMACGTPVIYGKNSSMPEIVGEAGLAADPNDVQEIKSRMHTYLFNPEKRQAFALKALKKASEYSWRQAAIATLEAYELALGKTE